MNNRIFGNGFVSSTAPLSAHTSSSMQPTHLSLPQTAEELAAFLPHLVDTTILDQPEFPESPSTSFRSNALSAATPADIMLTSVEAKSFGSTINLHKDHEALKMFSAGEIRIRQNGIRTETDIRLAFLYLKKLDPKICALIEAYEKNPVSITITDKQGSALLMTLPTKLDRERNGTLIAIELQEGCTPEVLLHEITHAIPISVVRSIFPEVPVTPTINPGSSYQEIFGAILETVRIDESISFSTEAYSWQKERELKIHPTLNSIMDDQLDDVYTVSGMQGVITFFSQLFPHYESREGIFAAIVALVIKISGKVEQTDQEMIQILNLSARGEILHHHICEFMQKYIDEFISSRGIEVESGLVNAEQLIDRHLAGSAARHLPGFHKDKTELYTPTNYAQALQKALQEIFNLLDRLSLKNTHPEKIISPNCSDTKDTEELSDNAEKLGLTYLRTVLDLLEFPLILITRATMAAKIPSRLS